MTTRPLTRKLLRAQVDLAVALNKAIEHDLKPAKIFTSPPGFRYTPKRIFFALLRRIPKIKTMFRIHR